MERDIVSEFYRTWNERDVAGVVGAFADGGTFDDPHCAAPVAGEALVAHLVALVDALHEIRFTVVRVVLDGAHAAVEWSLTALCKGALDRELVADGVRFTIHGTDVLELGETRIRAVRRIFDRRALADALGLQTIVEPFVAGTMTFGYSLRDWVSKAKPGALGMTWILARDDAEKAAIRGRAREIIRHFHGVPGFIGIVTGFAGLHGFTFTAWESEEALRDGTHAGPHREAMQAFGDGLAAAVFTSVWKPMRLNRLWTRCPNGHANDATREDRRCEQCGERLPEPEPYV